MKKAKFLTTFYLVFLIIGLGLSITSLFVDEPAKTVLSNVSLIELLLLVITETVVDITKTIKDRKSK